MIIMMMMMMMKEGKKSEGEKNDIHKPRTAVLCSDRAVPAFLKFHFLEFGD